MLTIKIQDKNGKTVFVDHGEHEVNLLACREYLPGDVIVVEIDHPQYVWVKIDETLEESLLYMKENLYFEIPFGEDKICYCPLSFTGERHLIHARNAMDWEINSYRNLALNTADTHRDCNCYPHATANVETRGEAVFAARNAIDGMTANSSHGEWPFGSWGINRDPKAEFKLYFGRKVTTDAIEIFERADFPHDNWWKEITIKFSDGEEMICPLSKTTAGQLIKFPEKETEWLILYNLIKSNEPSPFPALTQIKVFGRG